MELTGPGYAQVRERLIERFGAQRVEPWWAQLAALVVALGERWALSGQTPIDRPGNTSLVLRCRRADGTPAMLKLIPDPTLAGEEAAALRAWAPGRHAAAVLAHDAGAGAILLEAIADERPVARSARPVTTAEIAELIRALHRAPIPDDRIDPLTRRVVFIYDQWEYRHRDRPGVRDAIAPELITRARRRARELAADPVDPVLLHGDLHPGNLLDGGPGRGLVAIDPPAVHRDPAYDTVDWVFWEASPEDWEPRITQLAAAIGSAPDRVRGWCSIFAAIIAAGRIARGGRSDETDALLALAA